MKKHINVTILLIATYAVVVFAIAIFLPKKCDCTSAATPVKGGVVAEFKGGVPLQPAAKVQELQPAIGQ